MEDLRKLAADIVGRAALEERFGQRQLSALDAVTLEKIASADPELLKVAASFGSQNILKAYEELGGTYKHGGIGASLLGGAGKLIGQAALHPGAATAIGAGIGAAGGAIAGGEGHRLSGALGGAAAGGALGAGVSYGGHRLGQAGMKVIANDPATMAHLSKMHPGSADLIHAGLNKPWIGGAAHMQQAGTAFKAAQPPGAFDALKNVGRPAAATGGNVVSEMANQNKSYGY